MSNNSPKKYDEEMMKSLKNRWSRSFKTECTA